MKFVLVLMMSIYAPNDGHQKGTATSSGIRLKSSVPTCAHKTWPLGHSVKLIYGSHSIIAKLTDRGPWKRGRDLDCTPAVQKALHFPGLGHVRAELQ